MLETNHTGKEHIMNLFPEPYDGAVASIVLIWNVIFHYNGALNSLLVSSA